MPDQRVRACGYYSGATGRHCGAAKTRRYVQGWRCDDHTPAALAGRPEAAGRYCPPAICWCGRCPIPADLISTDLISNVLTELTP